jgi:PAS domain S-box-containing protein
MDEAHMEIKLFENALVHNAQQAVENQQRLQALFENARDAILMADEQMRFADANPAACVLTGYHREELLKLRVQDVTPLRNQSLLQEIWQNLISSGKLDGEYEIQRKDGTIITVEFRAVANIVPGLHMAILHDITARKLAEESMRKAQALTDSVLASVADTYILLDRQWRYLDVNEAAVRAIGKPREQILGGTLWELYPDILGTELEHQYHRAMDERIPVSFEFHYSRLDTWWDNRFYPIPEGLAIFATEITERKRAERVRSQLAAIVDSSDDAIISKSLDGVILSWNKGAERLYGYSAEEMIGQSISILIPPERPTELHEIMERLKQGEVIRHYETSRMRKDGANIAVSVTLSPVRDSSTRIIGAAAIGHDITRRKQAEAAQKGLYEQVLDAEKQLHQLANHLQTTREEERARLAREIHDQLGQALTALKMDLAWLIKRFPHEQSAWREKALSMSTLIDETVLAVRQIATDLRPGLLDHLGLVAAIEWHVHEFTRRTDIVCDLDLEEIKPVLEDGLATQLFRVIQEALTNIARHAQATQLTITLTTDIQTIILCIEDNGRGIQQNEMNSSKSLGLLGIRERALAYGGQFQIQGQNGKGTRLEVRIPRQAGGNH